VPRAPPDRRSARRTLQKEWLACQWFTTIDHQRGEIGLWLTGILTNHAIACTQSLFPARARRARYNPLSSRYGAHTYARARP
jgi:hypothetical protein